MGHENKQRADAKPFGQPFVRRFIPPITGAALSLTLSAGCVNLKNGNVTKADLRKVCKEFRDCDSSYFEDSYDSISDCVDSLMDDVENLREYYDEYGEDCADVAEAAFECTLRALRCEGGELEVEYAEYEECYDELYEAYEDACYD